MKPLSLAILVPIFNESKILDQSLKQIQSLQRHFSEWAIEVILIDSGSSDDSQVIASRWTKTDGWKWVHIEDRPPSTGTAVKIGLAHSRSEICLVLPVDTELPPASLSQLQTLITDKNVRCGGFTKQYSPQTLLLIPYQWIQNVIRLRILRHTVWTNGIFFPTNEAPTISDQGFLEDVLLSDELRKRADWGVVNAPLIVSARRYYPNRTLRRMLLNLFVMFCFRSRIAGPAKLKRLYLSLK